MIDEPHSAEILGGGLSAAAAVLTLGRFGWRPIYRQPEAGSFHPIVLNTAAHFMIEQLCGKCFLDRIAHHKLSGRLISWDGATPAILDEPSIVVDAQLVARTMLAERGTTPSEEHPGDCDVVVDGQSQPNKDFVPWWGGQRRAVSVPVTLSRDAQPEWLVIESGPEGWGALVPTGEKTGVLYEFGLSKGSDLADRILGTTPIIRRSTASVASPSGLFMAAPHLRIPADIDLARLPVGRAVMSFDALSGDGAATAIRTAHLAACIIQQLGHGGDRAHLRALYTARLAKAMTAHLRGLLSLYSRAPFAGRWAPEIHAMREMLSAIDSHRVEAWPADLYVSCDGIQRRPSAACIV